MSVQRKDGLMNDVLEAVIRIAPIAGLVAGLVAGLALECFGIIQPFCILPGGRV